MKTCVIFAGGPESGPPCLPVPAADLVLCADSGLRLAERLGVKPDLVLGDFDSLGAVPDALPVMTVPAEKDDTDTELAARTALARGCTEVTVFGAFGGRLDHMLGNLQVLEFLQNGGANGMLIGARDFAFLLCAGQVRKLPRRDGFSLSLFPLDETAVVSASGVFYPLCRETLKRGTTRGVSNEFTAECAEITCHAGKLLVVCSLLAGASRPDAD